jgi:hypothetical protein
MNLNKHKNTFIRIRIFDVYNLMIQLEVFDELFEDHYIFY